jgi:uncharacterized protein (TIGR00255 family)
MTGFGAASGEGAGIVVHVEARSVNHRHLQLKVRLPQELGVLEPRVEALVKKRLQRGSVTVGVTLSHTGGEGVAIDMDAAARYVKQLRRLVRELDLAGGIELSSVLALPGVVAADPGPGKTTNQFKVVLAAVVGALDGLVEMREREGAALEKDLVRHLAALRRTTARIAKRMPSVVREAQAALEKRVAKLLDARVPVQPADLAREVAMIADRGDVSEELARLESHADQLEHRLTKNDGAVGRQLDFLVQELVRELNTIGSKCGDAKVAHWVVEGKTTVERLREQVQNVE